MVELGFETGSLLNLAVYLPYVTHLPDYLIYPTSSLLDLSYPKFLLLQNGDK